ncbi:hypothetical protein B0H11DRAFT_1903793 [Mycena galericulata]|nr:hypothetical protein B0H11DRAFT_1903793 [Mycena galericulata]
MYHSPCLWILVLKPLPCLLIGSSGVLASHSVALGTLALSYDLVLGLYFFLLLTNSSTYIIRPSGTIALAMPQTESVSLDSGASAPGSLCGPDDALHAHNHIMFESVLQSCHHTTHSRISLFHSDLVTI